MLKDTKTLLEWLK